MQWVLQRVLESHRVNTRQQCSRVRRMDRRDPRSTRSTVYPASKSDPSPLASISAMVLFSLRNSESIYRYEDRVTDDEMAGSESSR